MEILVSIRESINSSYGLWAHIFALVLKNESENDLCFTLIHFIDLGLEILRIFTKCLWFAYQILS